MEWIYVYAAVLAEVVATSALKASHSFTRFWPTVLVVVGYSVAFYLLTLSLNRLPIGVVYAVWSAVGIVLVSLVGTYWFGQVLDAAALLGISLIITGVVIIQLFSKSMA